MSEAQALAARQARAEAVIEAVPADLLDFLKSKADGLPGLERAGAYSIIRILERHHRAVQRGDFTPKEKER